MTVRAIIAGAGLMGHWHAEAIEHAGGVVAGVVDRDAGAAARLASRHSPAIFGGSLEDVAGRASSDVVHVCTPLDTHADLIADGLGRGIHVLGEKPLARTAQDTERLYALGARQGVSLCPVHQFPFQRGVAAARRALHRIGPIHHFEARFCSAGGRGRDDAALDAIAADILPHPLSLMEAFLPGCLHEVDWVVARAGAGELRATGTTPGTCFSVLVSMSSRPTCAELSLRGANGTIHLDLFHGFGVIEPGAVSRSRKAVRPFDLTARVMFAAGKNLALRALARESAYPGLRALVRAFHSSVAAGTGPPIQREEVLTIAATRDALSAPSLRDADRRQLSGAGIGAT
jgi:predicted dehydrogenase